MTENHSGTLKSLFALAASQVDCVDTPQRLIHSEPSPCPSLAFSFSRSSPLRFSSAFSAPSPLTHPPPPPCPAPAPASSGSLFAYDDAIPFWNFLAVNNYASRFFRFAFVDVKDTQAQLQAWSSHAVQALEAELLPLLVGSDEENAETARRRVEGSSSSKHAPAPALPAAAVPSGSVGGPVGAGGLAVDGTNLASLLTEFSQNQATLVSVTWRKLLPRLITKFHDGYEARDLQGEHIDMHKLFYPQWWLEAVGFFLNKPTVGDGVILFASRDKTAEGTYSLSAGALGAIVVITSLLSTLIGVWVGTKAPWKRRWTYVSL